MAGSGICGQFEEKFKALLRDIEDEVRGLRSGYQFPDVSSEGQRKYLFY